MERRQFIQKSATVALAGGLLTNPAIAMPTEKVFIHHVYFWLANPESKADLDQLIAALKKLSEVPNIQQFHIGIPADTRREVIESSYQVSWCLFFANAEEEAIYQTHPLHLKFVEENKHLWKKVVVYDSVDI